MDIIFAGKPPMQALSGMSLVTTAFAPIATLFTYRHFPYYFGNRAYIIYFVPDDRTSFMFALVSLSQSHALRYVDIVA